MVSTTPASLAIATEKWIPVQWAKYLELLASSSLTETEARCYFDAGWMRLEISPLGVLHGREDSMTARHRIHADISVFK